MSLRWSTAFDPSCLTKTGTLALLPCCTTWRIGSMLVGRAPWPLSPPTITQFKEGVSMFFVGRFMGDSKGSAEPHSRRDLIVTKSATRLMFSGPVMLVPGQTFGG